MAGYDLTDDADTKLYLKNLGLEYQFSCFSEKQPESCQLLGEYLETIERNFPKAATLYQNTCDEYGVAKSCFRYANLVQHGKGCEADTQAAIKYYTRACSLGEHMACTGGGAALAAESAKEGLPDATRDDLGKRALEMLGEGCNKGDGFACNSLSGAYIKGDQIRGVGKDMIEAFKYATLGCDQGHMFACANLSQMYARGDGTATDAAKALALRQKAQAIYDEVKKTMKLNKI